MLLERSCRPMIWTSGKPSPTGGPGPSCNGKCVPRINFHKLEEREAFKSQVNTSSTKTNKSNNVVT